MNILYQLKEQLISQNKKNFFQLKGKFFFTGLYIWEMDNLIFFFVYKTDFLNLVILGILGF